MMRHWHNYVRAGWELVMDSQQSSSIYLDTDLEAFLVHLIARTLDKTAIWDEPIAIRLLQAQSLPQSQQPIVLRSVGEECLFIDAWQIKQVRWPNPKYFQEMGQVAFSLASLASRPPDELLDLVGNNIPIMSKVLRQTKNLQLSKH